jgi:hypothetical protein
LWVTYVEAGRVKVNWSRTNDLDWGDPADLPVAAPAIAVSSDDISAVVAFGGSSVGVMWSNQNQATTYFAFRRDTDLPEAWQPIERVLPGPGCAGACADDHLNLKTDQQGRVLVATKTSLTTSTAPLAVLAVRSATTPATWTIYPVGLKRDHHTRPIVVIDEQNNRLYVFATSGESGGTIYVKSSSLDEISFEPGLGQPFIQSAADTTINNVTSTRQNVDASTGLLVAASDQNTRFYLHGYLRLAGAPTVPAAPTGLVASVTSGTQVVLTWTDASSDEDAFSVERATGNGPFGLVASVGANSAGYTDTTVLEGTSYAYRVRAGNGAGFSAYSNTATAATPGGGGGVSAPIKDITFEGGALTDPATGADKVSGTVALETTAPLNGRFSARVPNAASAYVEEAFAATDDVYASVYVRLGALPAADARIVLVSTAGTSVGNLVVRTTGRLRLRVDTTTVGLESTPLAPGQLYRIGIRQKRGAAGNAVLEAFLAAGDAPFSTPFASTAAGAWTAAADRVRVGATNPGAIDLVFDDLRLDAAAMPGPAVRQLQAGTPAAGRPSLRSW